MIKKQFVRVFGGINGDVDAEGHLVDNGAHDTWVFWSYAGVAVYTFVEAVPNTKGKYTSFFFDLDLLQFEALDNAPSAPHGYRRPRQFESTTL